MNLPVQDALKCLSLTYPNGTNTLKSLAKVETHGKGFYCLFFYIN